MDHQHPQPPQPPQPPTEKERQNWLDQLWQWAPTAQGHLAKLERFMNKAVGEHDTRIDYLERQVEQLVSQTQQLRYQLNKAERERKELREEIEELHKEQALPPVPSERPPRPAPPPVPPRQQHPPQFVIANDSDDETESESD